MSAPVAQSPGPEAVIRVEGRAGRITLNRPRALNALTLAMVRDIWAALLVWRDDPAVDLVVLDGAGDRGLYPGASDSTGRPDGVAAVAGGYRRKRLYSENYQYG